MSFGLESRALALSILLSCLLGWVALHEYRAAATAQEAANTAMVKQVAEQNSATAADQHKADLANAAALQQQIQDLQSDANAAAGRAAELNARLHDQQEALNDARKHAQPGDCLNQPVSAALVHSLHTGDQGTAQPPGQHRPVR